MNKFFEEYNRWLKWNKKVKYTNFAPEENPRWYSGPHRESETARVKEVKRRRELNKHD